MTKTKLVVLFGGQSAEHEVSCVSVVHVLAALDTERYDVVPIGITQEGKWMRSESALAMLNDRVLGTGRELPKSLSASGMQIDAAVALDANSAAAADVVVLPVLHGPLGEDGTVQGMLELAGVPFVGAGVLGSAMAMDKAVAKQMLDATGVPQANWRFWRSWDLQLPDQREAVATEVEHALKWPVFVKPANMGSSVGVTKAHDREEFIAAVVSAMQFDDTIVVEEAISGREVEFGVLGNEFPQVSLPGEVFPGKEFYDFEDKYVDGNATFQIPADFPEDVIASGQLIAKHAYQTLRCEGMSRVDFFYEENGRGWLVNEVNTIPGFTPISMYPKLWAASGVAYAELVDRLIDLAKQRHRRRSVYSGRARLS